MSLRRLAASAAIGVLAAVIVSPWIVRSGVLDGDRPVAPVQDVLAEVPGWSGEVELADGSRLLVRIARLHADPRRQAFDARALRERLHPTVTDGEPFLCQVVRRAAIAPRPTSGPGTGKAPSVETGPALVSLTIVDDSGIALTTLPATGLAPAKGLVDPLAALVSPPTEPLPAGRSVTLLLFGREPRAAARAAFSTEMTVALVRTLLATGELDVALARIDGKNNTSPGVDGVRR